MENADLTCTYIIWLIFDGAKRSSAPTGDLVGGRQDPSRPMLMSSKLCISRDVPRQGYRCRWGIAPASPRVFLHDFAYLDIHPWHSSGPNQPPDMIWGGGLIVALQNGFPIPYLAIGTMSAFFVVIWPFSPRVGCKTRNRAIGSVTFQTIITKNGGVT